jgi:predicted PurR-regulated permease PerM
MLFFSLFLAYLILRPFLHTIIFAIVLASLFYPLQERLVRLTRGKRNTSALLTIFVIIFVIVIPLFFFLSTLITQGVDSVNKVNDWIHEGNLKKLADDPRIQVSMDWLRERFRFVDLQKLDIQTNLLQLSKNFGQFLLSRGANLLGDMAGIIARFFIMMFIIFFLVRDGEEMVVQIKYLAPLRTLLGNHDGFYFIGSHGGHGIDLDPRLNLPDAAWEDEGCGVPAGLVCFSGWRHR